MMYSLRTAILHGLLFVLVAVSFILPVILGAGALLPVPVAARTSVVVAGLALVDASFHAFSPHPASHARAALELSARRPRPHSGLAGVEPPLQHYRRHSSYPLPHRHFPTWGRRGAQCVLHRHRVYQALRPAWRTREMASQQRCNLSNIKFSPSTPTENVEELIVRDSKEIETVGLPHQRCKVEAYSLISINKRVSVFNRGDKRSCL